MFGDVLDEVIERLEAVDPDLLEAGDLRALALTVERFRGRVEAFSLRVLATLQLGGAWVDDGAHNAANWLAARTGTSRADAGSRCRLAGRSGLMPATLSALADGDITVAHLRMLARCTGRRTRDRWAEDEELLVEQARTLGADDLAKVVTFWLELADPDGPEPAAEVERNRLDLSHVGSRWKLDGDFDDETGSELHAALAEKADELFRRDRRLSEIDPTDPAAWRTPGNRRAEALHELVTAGAAAGGEATRRKPAFTVLADLRTATDHDHPDSGGSDGDGGAGERVRRAVETVRELSDGIPLARSTFELWGCDAHWCGALFGAGGEPLDLGRLVRHPTAAQRRMLVARDRGCAVPGCDRPPSWCDAHHIVWWEHGGTTDLDNLALLCRHHHRRIHRRKLVVRMIDHRPRFFHPWGPELDHPRLEPERPPGTGPPQEEAA